MIEILLKDFHTDILLNKQNISTLIGRIVISNVSSGHNSQKLFKLYCMLLRMWLTKV